MSRSIQVARVVVAATVALMLAYPPAAAGQNGTPASLSAGAGAAAVVPPADYVIGPFDKLSIVFWREKELSADVIVRPDGKVSLPLLNDVQASGLTPDQLRQRVTEEAKRFVTEPNATVVVTEIHSRKVFITGEVEKPGEYQLTGPTTVLQLIAMAGGLREYANKEKILVLRKEGAKETGLRFNYKDVVSQRNTEQNVQLRPGDTIVVP